MAKFKPGDKKEDTAILYEITGFQLDLNKNKEYGAINPSINGPDAAAAEKADQIEMDNQE